MSNTSILHGSHEVRFGIDYRYLAPHYVPFNYRLGIRFAGIPGALSGVIDEGQVSSFEGVTEGFQDLSLYGQDTWRVTPKLTLIYGLRWELNPAPFATGNQQLFTLTGFPDLASMQLALRERRFIRLLTTISRRALARRINPSNIRGEKPFFAEVSAFSMILALATSGTRPGRSLTFSLSLLGVCRFP